MGVPPNKLVVCECQNWRDLCCVEFPGIVKNDQKAIKTLGGEEAVLKACADKGANCIELKFRPDELYCKPTVSKKVKTFNLAIKIKRKKCHTSDDSNDDNSYRYSAEVIGVIDTMFLFTGMADFQVLPPGLNKAVPNIDYKLMQISEAKLSHDVPVFLPPLIFSKLDHPTKYYYKPDNIAAISDKSLPKVPGSVRNKRSSYTHSVNFSDKSPVPMSPHPSLGHTSSPHLTQLQQLFEERPIWSRGALQCKIRVSNVVLRSMLAHVGYNFVNGPWRTLWVRFGYDPRADPSGKQYQCLDFRMPKMLESVIEPAKRQNQLSRRSLSHFSGMKRHRVSELSEDNAQDEDGDEDASLYLFRADALPQQRQQFYQLCDLHHDSLQAIVHSNDGLETSCSELSGWCNDDCYENLRKAMTSLVVEQAKREGLVGPHFACSSDAPAPEVTSQSDIADIDS